ncbi:hypothetical protein N657DRAFT_633134 [Parathielavia appendiculata]|uniref:Arb2 domain-containing protein n=1 Tax=Parathielavia appendiculata TaxID=2587402 RepID=A0AAN6U2M0_9PEZI|nr:hypothetical protein N657DRAFT_633134 [Parathielavia appendiculata]
MFRRRWSGLPADPVFPADLKELGYFINDIDEIRSIENPDYYFKYFLTKNDRWNDRQRFAFNEAVAKEILTRLKARGFDTIPLPLGTPSTQPHIPILTSPDLPTKTRVVLLFGESCQSLSVLAHRVIGGRGGITRGSVLGFVEALNKQQSSATDPAPPGLVIANPGELWWWPEGGRGLNPIERHRVPMASAVHYGRYHDPKVNEVPGNRTVSEHVKGVFETVVMGDMVSKEAKVDVIVIGDVATEVEGYLNDDTVWERIGGKLNCMAILGGSYSSKYFKCEAFKQFMKKRARAYIIHHTHLGSPVAGAGGNPGAAGFTSFGCPVFSAGDTQVTETMLIEAQPAVLNWIQQVALEGETYKNVVLRIFGEEGTGITTEKIDSPWAAPEIEPDEGSNAVDQKEATRIQDEPGKDTAVEDTAVEDTAVEDTAVEDNREDSPPTSVFMPSRLHVFALEDTALENTAAEDNTPTRCQSTTLAHSQLWRILHYEMLDHICKRGQA